MASLSCCQAFKLNAKNVNLFWVCELWYQPADQYFDIPVVDNMSENGCQLKAIWIEFSDAKPNIC